MKRFALIISAGMMLGTTSAIRADVLPYFGGEPYNGSYLNSPQADFPFPAAFGVRGYDAYAQGACRTVRARRISANGSVYYRTRRVCS